MYSCTQCVKLLYDLLFMIRFGIIFVWRKVTNVCPQLVAT